MLQHFAQIFDNFSKMFNRGCEKKVKRGSCFVESSLSIVKPKPKKNIFTNPSTNNLFDYDAHRYSYPLYDVSAGDSKESMSKTEAKWITKSHLEPKKSRTLVVDKKNLKYGHFSKLKKKHQEDFGKFLGQRSKDLSKELDIYQMRATIEKIQEVITELSKSHQQKFEAPVVTVEAPKPTAKAIAVTVMMHLMIILLLYVIEGKHFFSPVKVQKPKSWFEYVFSSEA